MSNLTPAAGLSVAAADVIRELADSGQSEAYAVAECLNTIAENGEESATDAHLAACADELIAAATRFKQAIQQGLS